VLARPRISGRRLARSRTDGPAPGAWAAALAGHAAIIAAHAPAAIKRKRTIAQ
jgi:hypothetical protein